MYVIQVIPLTKQTGLGPLSYYSSMSYESGAIITIPVRNKEISGVVLESNEVSATKTALKAATFSLKKLPPQPDARALSPQLIKTASELAEYYASSAGSILFALLPPAIRNGDISLPRTRYTTAHETHQPELLQATAKDRYISYRSLVRETFAHSGSLLFIVPTSAEIYKAYEHISSGITDRTITLTSFDTKKQRHEAYKELDDFTKPKLIITTPTHSMLERHDITTVVVEHARSPYYRERTRPYIDYRTALKIHARHTGRLILFGDLLPRTEEEYERRNEHFHTFEETPKRVLLQGKLSVIHMKDKPDGTNSFKLFSPKVLDAITDTHKRKERSFLFCARRGLAPVVSCIDCSFVFRSNEAGAPFSLIKIKKDGEEKRMFVCPVSGHREPAADVCPLCGSWRLRERGIGIQHVHEELSDLLPDIPLILFDHTTANTQKKAESLRTKFYTTKGSIMLGTQMALPHLAQSVATSVVVNMDALYATPTWRLQEENLALLLELREQTKETVYIQTRTGVDEMMEHAKTGSVERFYDDEIELRKTFNYPPLAVFIHLTWQGDKNAVLQTESVVQIILANMSTNYYSAPPSPKGVYIKYALIRHDASTWPDQKLSATLRSLPPQVRIVMNPDRII